MRGRALRLSLVSGLLLLSSMIAKADLSTQDSQDLTRSLETLSISWDSDSVGTANAIFQKPEYTSTHFQAFFETFFAARPLTDPLWSYLNYPTFVWFADTTHLKLQLGLTGVAESKVQSVLSAHGSDLGSFLAAAPTDRASLFNWLRFLYWLGPAGTQAYDRAPLFQWHRDLVHTHPQWLTYPPVLDPAAQPFVNMVRSQVATNLRDALPLTAELKAAIADTLGLSGGIKLLWDKHETLINDNHFFNDRDLDFWDRLLDSLDARLPYPHMILVYDALGNTGGRFVWGAFNNAINVFAWHVGQGTGNSFPDDVPAYVADGTTPMYIHETFHIVDGANSSYPQLAAQKSALLLDAGSDPMNYLRSMLPAGFFVNSPQEFVASIGNQYGDNTRLNLDLGVKRLRVDGRHQPIEQALYMFDLLSLGGASASGYTSHPGGAFDIYAVALQRNGEGQITSVAFPDGVYTIVYGGDGHVTSVDTPCSLAITEVTKLGNPFRLQVTTSVDLTTGWKVYLGGAPSAWTNLKVKSPRMFLVKGAGALFTKDGTGKAIEVVSGDGCSVSVAYNRSTNSWH